MKTHDSERMLHERLCAGDPTASAEVFDKIVVPLVKRLKRQYLGVPPEDVEDVVLDLFVDYIQHPDQYDPRRGKSLSGYLQMCAAGDIKNLVASARYSRTVRLPDESTCEEGAVEPHLPHRNVYIEDSFVDAIASDDVAHQLLHLALEALPRNTDRAILRLILEGERRTARYAHVLGVEHLPESEQRAVVKRHTDRVKKVLRRLAGRAKGILQ